MEQTGTITIFNNGENTILPVTSSHAVLVDESEKITLAAKLGEIDKSISDIKTVTDNILDGGDGSIIYINDETNNEFGLKHRNITNIAEETDPINDEAIYKFKIDNNGHITEINKAGLEDFGIGMPIKYCGEYPTNNSSFTPSVGEMYLVNAGFISRYDKGDVNDFAIYDGEKFNIILSDINPNINLNNESKIFLYGTKSAIIYAPTELGEDGLVLTSTENGLEWKPIYAPTDLGNPGLVLATNANKNGLEWKTIPTYSSGDNYIKVENNEISLDTDAIKNLNTNIKIVEGNGITVTPGDNLYTIGMNDITVSPGTDNNSAKIGIDGGDTEVILQGSLYISITPNSDDKKITFKLSNITDNTDPIVNLNTEVSNLKKSIYAMDNNITSDDNTHVKVKVTQTDGNITDVVVIEDDALATENNLNAEIAARKAVDGQNGDKYSANDVNYINNATSLNDADIKLSNAITELNTKFQNEIWGTNVDSTKDSRIDKLETNVGAINGTYSYVINEIYGDGTTDNNWNIDKKSRIDNLETDVNSLNIKNYLYEIFDWSLVTSDNVYKFVHENGLLINRSSSTTKINVKKAGTYLIKFKCIFKSYSGESINITINDSLISEIKNGSDIEKLIESTNGDIEFTIPRTIGLSNLSILSDNHRNLKKLVPSHIYKQEDEFTEYVTSGEANIYHTSLEEGFYKISFNISSSETSSEVLYKTLSYPVVNGGFYNYEEPYYMDDDDNYTVFTNDLAKFHSTNNIIVYYHVNQPQDFFIRGTEAGTYTVSNLVITKLKLTDFSGEIDNSIINNPFLSLTSANSKLYNRISEDDNSNQYILLVYEADGEIKWTLDLNGFTMASTSKPIEIQEQYYYSRNDPYTINNFNLFSCNLALYKISNDTIYDENSNEASEGYYISFIAQVNLDGSTTHTLINYRPENILNKISRNTIIISSSGAIQDGILYQ